MKQWAYKWRVSFEPAKCKGLKILRKRQPSRVDLHFGNTKITEVDELEILGITVDKKLTWNKHIRNISSRAGQRLGALRRVAPKLDAPGRATVYKGQIRSIMEYASLCWLNASPTVLQLLDRIQDEARSNFNIPSLHHRRQVAAAVALYKMQTGFYPQDLKKLVPPPYTTRRTTRSSVSTPRHALVEPKSRTHSTGRSFVHTAVTVWNSLPEDIVGMISDRGSQSSKSRVHNHLLQIV
ncbi:uncharacterized protein [Diadema setosum]|uniref:uncharacterized protein n=1 Tax=Diadema setosum TaxID=31175 RepID=UPI003B3A4B4A